MGKDGQSVFARCDLQQELDMNKKETACLQVDQRQTQTQTQTQIQTQHACLQVCPAKNFFQIGHKCFQLIINVYICPKYLTYLRIAQLSIFDGLKIEGCQLKKMRVWRLSVKHWKSHNLSQLDAAADLLPISCTDE